MRAIFNLLLFIPAFIGAQSGNDFARYGPFNEEVFSNLKIIFKEKNLPKVLKLDLQYQASDSLLYQRIGELTDLQALRLSQTGRSDYPKNFDKLNNLVYFGSFNISFKTFPPVLQSYPNLMQLELHNSEVDSVPGHIAYLNRLQTLRISNTNDTLRLPNTLKFLRSLKELSIENCILDSFPREIFKISSLKYLFLSNTNTCYLSKHFENLVNLEVMVIENNGLRSLPSDIYKAGKLRIIALRGNKINKLPDTISQLTNLTILDLRGNPIDKEEIEKLKLLLPGCEVRF